MPKKNYYPKTFSDSMHGARTELSFWQNEKSRLLSESKDNSAKYNNLSDKEKIKLGLLATGNSKEAHNAFMMIVQSLYPSIIKRVDKTGLPVDSKRDLFQHILVYLFEKRGYFNHNEKAFVPEQICFNLIKKAVFDFRQTHFLHAWPHNRQVDFFKLLQIENEFSQKNGRKPNEFELAKALTESRRNLKTFTPASAKYVKTTLQMGREITNLFDHELLGSVTSKRISAEKLTKIIESNLMPSYAEVLLLKLDFEGEKIRTNAEVGRIKEITRERVRQIMENVKRVLIEKWPKIQKQIGKAKLSEFGE
ncbi:MAG: hypothetical protein ABH821_04895 [archaeon]